jgi:hypothetical protein
MIYTSIKHCNELSEKITSLGRVIVEGATISGKL